MSEDHQQLPSRSVRRMTQPMLPVAPPRGPKVIAYGGGVNSVAVLLWLASNEYRPDAIVMADPGDEWPETIEHRDNVMQPWCAAHGFPPITVVSVATEAPHRPRASKTEHGTLRDECMRIHSLPSIAYGWKKCSQKYKARPFLWWAERQPFIREAWARGERIVRVIGYDIDELRRARGMMMDPAEAKLYQPWYPLIEHGFGREESEALIRAHGLAVPHKSACTFCPSNSLAEWKELRRAHPDRFADALAMEDNAKIDEPDVVGLVRVAPHGQRQLRVLDAVEREEERDAACGCGT